MVTRALDGGKVLVADLAGTAYCTLEGLQVLLKAHAAAAATGAQLQLAPAGPAVRRLFERTGADQILQLYPGPAPAQDGQATLCLLPPANQQS
jgi:anti-anti-sigma regulatory factor